MSNSDFPMIGKPRSLWTNFPIKTPQDAATMLKAMNSSDLTSADLGNQTFLTAYMLVHEVTFASKEDGEILTLPRVVLFNPAKETVRFVSESVMDCVHMLVYMWGAGPWNPPLPIKLVRQKGSSGFDYFLLEVDIEKPMPKLRLTQQ